MQDPSGNGAHVGAPVTPDLRLIAHAAHRHPDELAAQCLGDALAQRRLAHARGTHEAEDAPARAGVQGPDGQVFENAILDRGKVVMVAVQHLARSLEVEAVG